MIHAANPMRAAIAAAILPAAAPGPINRARHRVFSGFSTFAQSTIVRSFGAWGPIYGPHKLLRATYLTSKGPNTADAVGFAIYDSGALGDDDQRRALFLLANEVMGNAMLFNTQPQTIPFDLDMRRLITHYYFFFINNSVGTVTFQAHVELEQ